MPDMEPGRGERFGVIGLAPDAIERLVFCRA
jgi:hypothetical protein